MMKSKRWVQRTSLRIRVGRISGSVVNVMIGRLRWRRWKCGRREISGSGAHRQTSATRRSGYYFDDSIRSVPLSVRRRICDRVLIADIVRDLFLTRHLKPAARKLGLDFANWRCLRTSRATWMVEAGANIKAVQGLMRHSQIQTTLDVYAQHVPEEQRRAVEVTDRMAAGRIANAREALRAAAVSGFVN